VSDLPKGWARGTLGEIGTWGSGGTPRKGHPEFYDGTIPWAVIGDLNDSLVYSTQTSITPLGLKASSAKLIKAGSLLVAMYGSIGKLGIAGMDMATNQAIAFFRPNGVIDTKYLFWYLLSQRQHLGTAGKGATQQNISQTILKSWPVRIPPAPEQQRIVEAIEEHFSRIDAAGKSARSARGRLASFWNAALHKVFDPAWDRPLLDKVNDPERPICYGILKPKTPNHGVIPYVEVRSISKGQIKVDELHKTTLELHEAFPRSCLKPHDVVMAIRGSYDRAAVVPATLTGANVSRDVARMSPTRQLLPGFLAAFLVSPEAQRYFSEHARGVAVQGVNIGDLRRLPVPVPTIDDQRTALDRIERLGAASRRIREEIDLAERRSRQLRRSVLSRAFSGRLVAQVPDDEPVSHLLERIKGERLEPLGHNNRKKKVTS